MKNVKRCFCLLTTALLSLALLAGCGSPGSSDISGRKWSDTDAIDAYGTVIRNGEPIDVCICHDQEAVYLYYDDEAHELFDTAIFPTDELYDQEVWNQDWDLSTIGFSDFSGDNNGDLQVTLSHSDMSESHIDWKWEEGAGYVYQPDYSQFYHPIVIYGPEDDLVTDFSGTWYLDGDLSALTYIIIDSKGNWSCYQRVPGDPEATRIDCGTFSYSTNESGVYNADSTMYDGVKYRVLDFDEGVLVWGDEGTYYRLEE